VTAHLGVPAKVDLTMFSHLFSRSSRTAYHPKTYPEAGLANLAVT
jgi:hypothetical protein